jgi:Flp pilus assembly protein TadD
MVFRNLAYTALLGWYGVLPFIKSLYAQAVNLRSLWRHADLPLAAFPLLALFAYAVPVAAAVVLGILAVRDGPDRVEVPKTAVRAAADGRAHLALDEFAAAAARFQQAVDESPDTASFRFDLGYALFRLDRLEAAATQLARGFELRGRLHSPREARVYGDVLAGLGRDAEAKTYYATSIREADDPAFGRTLSPVEKQRFLARVHRAYQKTALILGEDVLKQYRDRLAGHPESALFLYLLGCMEPDPAERERLYRRAAETDSTFFEPAYARAHLLWEEGDVKEAEEAARKALAFPLGKLKTLALLTEIKLARFDTEGAAQTCLRMKKIAPKAPHGEVYTGLVHVAKGDFDKAAGILTAFLDRHKGGYWTRYAQLGLGMAFLGASKDGAEHLARAAGSRSAPVAEKARLWLGEAYAGAGKDPRKAWNEGPVSRRFEGQALAMLRGKGDTEAFLKKWENARPAETLYFLARHAGLWGQEDRRAALKQKARSHAQGNPLIRILLDR